MKDRLDKNYINIGIMIFGVIAASMLFYFGIFQINTILEGIRKIFSIMAPIVYGAAIAYVLCPVMSWMEMKVFYLMDMKKINKTRKKRLTTRWIIAVICMLLFLLIIYNLVMMVLPQLIRSIMSVIQNFPQYANEIQDWIDKFVARGGNIDKDTRAMILSYFGQAETYLSTDIMPRMESMLMNVTSGVWELLVFLKNFLIGCIVALYIMVDKEIFVSKFKMAAYALLPVEKANFLVHGMRFANKTFGGFISGKVIDSAIIGVLCYIGVVIMDMPYQLLISVVVGITNVIPFFGPYFGAIPCIMLILLSNPVKALYFAIFILFLQQLDGNVIGPKILGDSTGLSSFMVIVAILVGGGLFGVPGMIVGVPVCAVIYAAVQKLTEKKLVAKKLPLEEEKYYLLDSVDEATNDIIVMKNIKHEKNLRERTETLSKKLMHGVTKEEMEEDVGITGRIGHKLYEKFSAFVHDLAAKEDSIFGKLSVSVRELAEKEDGIFGKLSASIYRFSEKIRKKPDKDTMDPETDTMEPETDTMQSDEDIMEPDEDTTESDIDTSESGKEKLEKGNDPDKQQKNS